MPSTAIASAIYQGPTTLLNLRSDIALSRFIGQHKEFDVSPKLLMTCSAEI
jgi:hypothetical protein